MVEKVVRRKDGRVKFLLFGIFVAIFLFSFLAQEFKDLDDEADAASLENFDPGYIISDYQMENYNSMNESEIQAFLKAKGNCRDTRTYLASYYPSYTYHIKDGHFVCLAEETFGEGTAYGEEAPNGESAAHVIYRAAQDYRINPQVLIVLLQKEQGLITDSWPNNRQFKVATGYGCPDTAPCNSEYYGFKNQVRKAAAMFRTVLNGGWTNYPLGNNYIQYNPSAACGGSVVNIRSLATSALYRYTPYQPNASALAAGYGSGNSCGAYGNRNFYLYFEDWFGGITEESARYVQLENPRYMEVVETTKRLKSNMEVFDIIEKGRIIKFITKTFLPDGTMCLRSEFGTTHNEDVCIPFRSLRNVELKITKLDDNEEMIIVAGAEKTYIRGGVLYNSYKNIMTRKIVGVVDFMDKKYYITEFDYENSNAEYGFEEKFIKKMPKYEVFDKAKLMGLKTDAKRVNPVTQEYHDTLLGGTAYEFASMIEVGGVKYYRTKHNTTHGFNLGISEKNLMEVNFVNLDIPGYFKLKKPSNRINVITGKIHDTLDSGREIKFTTKIKIDGEWYYRTEHNTLNNLMWAVSAKDLERIN